MRRAISAAAVDKLGGIGEHAWRARERVLEGMGWIGIDLDRGANRQRAEVISSPRRGYRSSSSRPTKKQ